MYVSLLSVSSSVYRTSVSSLTFLSIRQKERSNTQTLGGQLFPHLLMRAMGKLGVVRARPQSGMNPLKFSFCY